MTAAMITAAALLVVIAWMARRLANVHQDLADAYALVTRMLRAPDLDTLVREAEAHRLNKIAQGRWRT